MKIKQTGYAARSAANPANLPEQKRYPRSAHAEEIIPCPAEDEKYFQLSDFEDVRFPTSPYQFSVQSH